MDGNCDAISIDSNPLLRIPSKRIASRVPPEEQAGAARGTDRRETRGMSLICQYTIRTGVLNQECPRLRPVLQSGHGLAAARQGVGRATRIGPSDGSQVVAGCKKQAEWPVNLIEGQLDKTEAVGGRAMNGAEVSVVSLVSRIGG